MTPVPRACPVWTRALVPDFHPQTACVAWRLELGQALRRAGHDTTRRMCEHVRIDDVIEYGVSQTMRQPHAYRILKTARVHFAQQSHALAASLARWKIRMPSRSKTSRHSGLRRSQESWSAVGKGASRSA